MQKNQGSPSIVIGTTNPGKCREIKDILNDPTHHYSSLADYPKLPPEILNISETGLTFTENALIKATTIGNRLKLPVIAEDSGLVVTALNGRPGIHSHRYGLNDTDRLQKLLKELVNFPKSQRSAQFICVAVYYHPLSHLTYISLGQVEGFITKTLKGNQGFGYDPVFYCPQIKKTFAQASQREKNRVSHRYHALSGLKTMYLSGDQI